MTSTPDPQTAVPVVAGRLTVVVPQESALVPLAQAFAAALPARAFVTLEGDLGAGKTSFVKAVAAAAGLDPAGIVSPTFGLIHVHPLPGGSGRRLVHADFYRLAGAGDLPETGWDDAIVGLVWVFVEWPQRIASALPAERLDVAIGIDGENARTFSFTARGVGHAPVVEALRPLQHEPSTKPPKGL